MFDHTSGTHIAVNNASIYVEEHGDKRKPTLLLLHGGFQTLLDMDSLAVALADDFHIIGMDNRGHGKSTLGQGPLTFEQMQKDVEAILTHLHIPKVTIMGFSDGSTVALRVATAGAVNVDKLVVIGALWDAQDAAYSAHMFKDMTPEVAQSMFSDFYTLYQSCNPEPDFCAFTNAMLAMWMDTNKGSYPGKAAATITAPTLLIRGDKDFLVSLESSAILAGLIPKCRFLNVPFAKHLVHEEQAETCLYFIKQFLGISSKRIKQE